MNVYSYYHNRRVLTGAECVPSGQLGRLHVAPARCHQQPRGSCEAAHQEGM